LQKRVSSISSFSSTLAGARLRCFALGQLAHLFGACQLARLVALRYSLLVELPVVEQLGAADAELANQRKRRHVE
jgi:hypothetical protein